MEFILNLRFQRIMALISRLRRPIQASIRWAKLSTGVSQIDAITTAGKNANALVHRNLTLKQKLAVSARILADAGHGASLAGQVSCRDQSDAHGDVTFWTGVYGKSFDEMNPSDFIKVGKELNVLEGEGSPNLATRFHSHVYRNRPDIQCIVHSHPLHTSALAQLGVPLFISHMDHMALYDDVQFLQQWPGVPFGDEEGEIITGVLAPNHHAALLAHHGLIVTGRSVEEAVYRAFFFERAAQVQLEMMSANGGSMANLPQVDSKLAAIARDWRISEGPVKAHYSSWSRMTLKTHGEAFLEL